MEQKITTDLELIDDILDEIVRLYFLGNSINSILMNLEKSIGKELFYEVKRNICEVTNG